mmetsp:Transcript_4422/g.8585  ORF Transcript_4422/g.8585 Transcript_4422/m.8585 type:complete len:214 (-) Transcript_4422:123-764(-)
MSNDLIPVVIVHVIALNHIVQSAVLPSESTPDHSSYVPVQRFRGFPPLKTHERTVELAHGARIRISHDREQHDLLPRPGDVRASERSRQRLGRSVPVRKRPVLQPRGVLRRGVRTVLVRHVMAGAPVDPGKGRRAFDGRARGLGDVHVLETGETGAGSDQLGRRGAERQNQCQNERRSDISFSLFLPRQFRLSVIYGRCGFVVRIRVNVSPLY